jgi:hypothetical protein
VDSPADFRPVRLRVGEAHSDIGAGEVDEAIHNLQLMNNIICSGLR